MNQLNMQLSEEEERVKQVARQRGKVCPLFFLHFSSTSGLCNGGLAISTIKG